MNFATCCTIAIAGQLILAYPNWIAVLHCIIENNDMIPSTTTTTQIVVEKSTVPVKAAESIANILGHNNKPGVQFQVRLGAHRWR